MSDRGKTWLDALTDGQILRDWFSLNVHFFLGIAYLAFLIAGFATSIGLMVLLVGIPLLLFMLAATRTAARMDRQLTAAILNIREPEVEADRDLRGANLGERLGYYLGSGQTWTSLVYLLLKFPLGIAAGLASWLLLPLIALEVLVLGPLTIDMRLATVRLLHALAIGFHRYPGILLPARKRKRPLWNRLELDEEDEAPTVVVDDDGEVIARYRS